MDKQLVKELKKLKNKNKEDYLKKLNYYKKEDPELYAKIIKSIKIEEVHDVPPDLMRAGDKAGPLQIKPSETIETIVETELGFNWMLLTVVLGLILLIIVFIILFLLG